MVRNSTFPIKKIFHLQKEKGGDKHEKAVLFPVYKAGVPHYFQIRCGVPAHNKFSEREVIVFFSL